MASHKFTLIARQFSTSSVGSQLVKPPVQLFGVGGRYATALYSAATKEKKLDVVDGELKKVEESLTKNEVLSNFVKNPVVKRKEKSSVVEDFLKSQKMSPLTVNFFSLLAENNRLAGVSEVFDAWGQLMSAHRGEVVCNITTAKKLSAAQEKALQEALKGYVKKDQKIKVNMQIDPAILGGMVVEIGDRYVDMSTATKIRDMTNLLKQTV